MVYRKILALLAVVVVSHGWLFPVVPPIRPRGLVRKKLAIKKKRRLQKKLACATAATTAGVVGLGVGGAALTGAAALAFVVQQQQQSGSMQTSMYTPAPGSLQGQVFLITGGTTGMGLETAKRLSRGTPAQIIITARTAVKGEEALADIRSYMEQNEVDAEAVTLSYKVLDLDDLQGIKDAVASWMNDDGNNDDALPTINGLVNNAGIMALPYRELTVDGIERQMQSNHLGHFALTALLAPKLANDARIINVSSAAHMIAQMSRGMDFDYCWTGEPGYGAWRSYGQSKLANILFSQELQRRADEADLDWKVGCLHPGGVSTDLGRNLLGIENWERLKNILPDGDSNSLWNSAASSLSGVFLKTVEQGATTAVYLAAGASPDDPRARYYVDCEPVTLNEFARDATAAKQLWNESELKSGVVFTLEKPAVVPGTEEVEENEVEEATTEAFGEEMDDDCDEASESNGAQTDDGKIDEGDDNDDKRFFLDESDEESPKES